MTKYQRYRNAVLKSVEEFLDWHINGIGKEPHQICERLVNLVGQLDYAEFQAIMNRVRQKSKGENHDVDDQK